MATLANIVSRLRLELDDPALSFQAKVTADGSTDRFNLPVVLVEATGLTVWVDEVEQTLDTDYTMDYRDGVVIFTNEPTTGAEIVVEGTHYETFLTSDLETFVNTAFSQHAHQRTNDLGLDLTLAELPTVEEYPLVILAQIEALWSLVVGAAQEVDVRSPDGVNIPVGQRYEQLINLIAARRADYLELAQALNVGLNRIEMFTLRRVSRTTNRLVPIYQAMEYDQLNYGFVPIAGPVGTTVTIKGNDFTGATEVTFGGVAAGTFTVETDEIITAEVPAGAVTGRIKVTTPGGSVESQYNFTVGALEPKIAHGMGGQRLYPPIDDGLT